MSEDEKIGTLRMLSSRRWAISDPVELTSGDVFRVEGDDGVLRITRMEYTPGRGYYAVDGPPLCAGLRAAIGSGE
jgi:hypothetical protein